MADTTARTLKLLSLLQTHRFWPGGELADRLGVSDRTLRRDVDRLRELGYPVDATPGVAGGYRLASGSHLPPLLLDDDEAVAIAVGLQAAAGAAVDGIEDHALGALAKLEQVMPDRLRRRIRALHGSMAVLRWGTTDALVDPDALGVLAQGCRDGEEVRFDYRRRDGEDTNRLVQPHHLVAVGRRWYLVAWDCRREDWRTFRVDRLTDARLAGARFAPQTIPGGDPAEFVARSLRSMPAPHHIAITVRATEAEVVDVVRWAGAEATAGPAGTTRLALRADAVGWLVANATSLAARFEVVAVDGDAEVVAALEVALDRLGRIAPAIAPTAQRRGR